MCPKRANDQEKKCALREPNDQDFGIYKRPQKAPLTKIRYITRYGIKSQADQAHVKRWRTAIRGACCSLSLSQAPFSTASNVRFYLQMTIVGCCHPVREARERATERCSQLIPCLSDPGIASYYSAALFFF